MFAVSMDLCTASAGAKSMSAASALLLQLFPPLQLLAGGSSTQPNVVHTQLTALLAHLPDCDDPRSTAM